MALAGVAMTSKYEKAEPREVATPNARGEVPVTPRWTTGPDGFIPLSFFL